MRSKFLLSLLVANVCWLALPVLSRATAADAREVALSIAELGAPEFRTREAAEQRLIEWGDAAPEPVLAQAAQAWAAATDPEVRARLRQVLRTLVERHIIDRPKAFLGVHFNLTIIGLGGEMISGVQVVTVTPESAAETAGIAPGDLIRGIDDRDLSAPEGPQVFVNYIRGQPPGKTVTLRLRRGEEDLRMPVKLGEMPTPMRQGLLPESERQRLFEQWLEQAVSPPPVGE